MQNDDAWVLVDTETTGLRSPIFPVEIAAQRMLGWAPFGEGFHALLNFDVPIEPGAEDVHGYSREYLRANGMAPPAALQAFADYVLDRPVVAYNLTYDWDRVLIPTFRRMRMEHSMKRGFCALDLARALAPTLPNHRLSTLVRKFRLANGQAHHAASDVKIVIRFFTKHVAPHLAAHGIQGFSAVAACAARSRKVPPLEAVAARKKSGIKANEAAMDAQAVLVIGEPPDIAQPRPI